PVIRTREVSENALSRHVCQSIPGCVFALEIALPFEQKKEECLVFEDGAANAAAKLIAVAVVLLNIIQIVEPGAGIKRGVMVRPEEAPMICIRSGASDHAHLTGSPRCLRVDRRDNALSLS